MCNRVATPEEDEIKGYFDKVDTNLSQLFKVDDYEQFYHVTAFTRPMLPFVSNDDPLHIATAMWKFIPENVRYDAYDKYDTCNAKSEEIFEKRTYKDYIMPKRGLVVLKGFYEGQAQPDKTSQPYFIYPKEGGVLTLGCVYSERKNPDTGEPFRTFSIITTEANELMAEIHNKKKRMPVVILPEDRERWLNDIGRDEVEELMKPLPDGLLSAHKITRNIYKRGFDNNVREVQMSI